MQQKPEDRAIHILTSSYARLPDIIPLPPTGVELDLGCGNGSFTTQLAAKYPERLILAADVMIGRLRKLVKRNQRENVSNIVPLRVEARHLLGYMLPDDTIDRLHILCPDPWPKGRHRSHRLLCSDFIARLHRVLVPGGIFHFSTDDENYYEIVCRVINASQLFRPLPAAGNDISDLKSDFERRWLEQGKSVRHVNWQKIV